MGSVHGRADGAYLVRTSTSHCGVMGQNSSQGSWGGYLLRTCSKSAPFFARRFVALSPLGVANAESDPLPFLLFVVRPDY